MHLRPSGGPPSSFSERPHRSRCSALSFCLLCIRSAPFRLSLVRILDSVDPRRSNMTDSSGDGVRPPGLGRRFEVAPGFSTFISRVESRHPGAASAISSIAQNILHPGGKEPQPKPTSPPPNGPTTPNSQPNPLPSLENTHSPPTTSSSTPSTSSSVLKTIATASSSSSTLTGTSKTTTSASDISLSSSVSNINTSTTALTSSGASSMSGNTTSPPSPPSTSGLNGSLSTNSHNANTVAIVAGVVAPLVLIILAAAGFLLYRRRRRARDRREWERTHAEIADAVRYIGASPESGMPTWRRRRDEDGDPLFQFEKDRMGSVARTAGGDFQSHSPASSI
ncbi:hypothetical protein B0H19DRAFT_523714 [Mycena capillaripes]|nr:hypothetical protein B0H19DRAFT_523714 [Mycena capillaripes]